VSQGPDEHGPSSAAESAEGAESAESAEGRQAGYRDAAAAGISVLQGWYSRRTGLWKTVGWWNSANALTAVIRYSQATGDRSYLAVAENTFTRAQRAFIKLQRRKRRFINDFFDDNLWWALAWVAAGDLTPDEWYRERYRAAAQAIFAHCLSGWDDTCGGGLWWNEKRDYKNAITNELFLTLAALLAVRVPGQQEYRDWALREWEWLHGSGLIGPSGLVNDGLSAACANNGGTTWTYNQGVILGGLTALHQITGDQGYLRQAEVIADAALRALTDARGILAEPSEPAGSVGDHPQFKGIFVRNLHELHGAADHPAYRAFLLANADSVWDNARNPADEFGLRWAGPFDAADASRQSSAAEALIAAAALTAPGH
jgi:predicted alpha-1,6-mannanase (GH76 family)